MRKFPFVFFLIIISLGASLGFAKSSKEIEVFFGRTTTPPPGWVKRPFKIITQISGEAGNNQKAVKKIKKAAAKEGADAVIGIECKSNTHQGVFVGQVKTTVFCYGEAIKYTGPAK